MKVQICFTTIKEFEIDDKFQELATGEWSKSLADELVPLAEQLTGIPSYDTLQVEPWKLTCGSVLQGVYSFDTGEALLEW